ncbi:hypothetical protein A138_09015 [Vibrio crassostreae 9ZC77]|nr:hypothetical protein A138_09015 [Vibrio crassostreae 9ZC77]
MNYESEDKRLHLELIQSVISRMATNSFSIKGWTVTLIAGLMALSAATASEKLFFFIAYVPAFAFWILDSYFLSLEKIYRKIYTYTAHDLLTAQEYYSLDKKIYISRFRDENNYKYSGFKHIANCCFNKTIWPFYLGLIALVSLIFKLAL